MIRTLATLGFLLVSTTSVWAEDPAAAEVKKVVKPAAEMVKKDSATAKSDTKGADTKDAKKAEAETAGVFAYVPKESDIVYGKDDAPLTIVEYASYSCSHCGAFYKDVFPLLQKEYIDTGKLKLVFRSFPLNQPALEAAQMVQCADKSNRATYVKVLFNTQEKWAYDANFRESLAGIAVLGGMERSKFDECIASKDVQNNVLVAYQEAQAQFKVDSTPTIFLNNEIIKGDHSIDIMRRALEKALLGTAKK
jgi:protein-disulfide isomerase